MKYLDLSQCIVIGFILTMNVSILAMRHLNDAEKQKKRAQHAQRQALEAKFEELTNAQIREMLALCCAEPPAIYDPSMEEEQCDDE